MNTRKSPVKKIKVMADLKELEKLIGSFMQYWGFKKIHGRIWTHLYTSIEPLDSQTLISRLKVSKGLMSLAVRDLLTYEVILPVSTGKHGVTFYKANPDVMNVITNVLKKREATMLSSVNSCVERLAAYNKTELSNAKLDFKNLENIKVMTQSAQGLLNLFILQSTQNSGADNIGLFSELNFQPNLKNEA